MKRKIKNIYLLFYINYNISLPSDLSMNTKILIDCYIPLTLHLQRNGDHADVYNIREYPPM
jgi:hypothetical protein